MLTYEDRIEVDAYKQKLIDDNTTKAGWGARWLDGVMIEELKGIVYQYEADLYSKRYEELMLKSNNTTYR